jgi:tight adherence protein B
MSKLRLAAAGLALIVLALPTAATAAVQLRGVDASAYPTIRASVVSPKGASTQPAITENGQAVAGLQAQNLGRAKAIALVIDRSQSMRGKPLTEATAAARAFMAAKQSADEVSVFAFGSAPLALSPFSTFTGEGDAALARLRPDSARGTALYDAISVAAQALKNQPLPGRVIIVLTDGADNASKRTIEQSITAARDANAAIYSIGIEGKGFTPDPLFEVADATGGQYYGAESTSDLRSVYGTIAETLKRTWRIQYVTTARPGDQIRVSAAIVGQGTATGRALIPKGNLPKQPEPSKLFPTGAYGPGGPLGIAVAVGMLVLLACLFFLSGIRGSWVRNRIAVHLGEARANSKKHRKERRLQMLASLFRLTEGAFGQLKQWRWIGRMLERADIPLKTAEFFWIMVGAAAIGGFVGLVLGFSPLLILGTMGFGALIPLAWAWRKMRKRLNAFEEQLPDMLITIAASLKAGHSFKQGLQAVVDEGNPPANEEFRRVLTETSLGRPMDDALDEMADRCGSKNFEFAITAVTIQRQVGGSLATLFDMVADTVRQRQQFARKVKSLTAMGRMSAYTLVGVPFFIAGTVTLLNPSYMHPLYHTSTGHFLIGLGLGMMAVGSFILKKIVAFKG